MIVYSDPAPENTLENTAKTLGLSVEQVRQIEKRALRKLRRNPEMQRIYRKYKEMLLHE